METDNGKGLAYSATAMRTAEMVTDGHPDKFCDQVADAILDAALKQDPKTRAGVECLAKDSLLVVTGEVTTRAELNVEGIARDVWERVVGYGPGEELTVISHIKLQSPDIARGGDHLDATGVDAGGAGDQGIMIGYATNETSEMLPREYVLARALCQKLLRDPNTWSYCSTAAFGHYGRRGFPWEDLAAVPMERTAQVV